MEGSLVLCVELDQNANALWESLFGYLFASTVPLIGQDLRVK